MTTGAYGSILLLFELVLAFCDITENYLDLLIDLIGVLLN
jgi:hypothetical protein